MTAAIEPALINVRIDRDPNTGAKSIHVDEWPQRIQMDPLFPTYVGHEYAEVTILVTLRADNGPAAYRYDSELGEIRDGAFVMEKQHR